MNGGVLTKVVAGSGGGATNGTGGCAAPFAAADAAASEAAGAAASEAAGAAASEAAGAAAFDGAGVAGFGGAATEAAIWAGEAFVPDTAEGACAIAGIVIDSDKAIAHNPPARNKIIQKAPTTHPGIPGLERIPAFHRVAQAARHPPYRPRSG